MSRIGSGTKGCAAAVMSAAPATHLVEGVCHEVPEDTQDGRGG
jgi:hypothetical protein